MFLKVATFEFRFQLRQPAFWVISILFGLIGFGLIAAGDNISFGGAGAVHVNSPYAISLTHGGMAMFFMLATTAIVANVIARDATTGFGPIIMATRLSKFDYLYGRFVGAFGVVALSFLSIAAGMLVGTLMPWVDRETLGAFRPGDYAYAYLFIGMPTVFLTSAVFFTLSTMTRSMMATYVGVVAFFILYAALTSALDRPEYRDLLAWLEPFGGSAFGNVTRYWTPAERNTQNPPIEGVLLYNKLIWTLAGLAFLVAAYPAYRPATRDRGARNQARLGALGDTVRPAPASSLRQLPDPGFGAGASWTQLRRRTTFEMALILRSPAYLILVALGAFLAVSALLFAGETYGAPTLLVTRLVIQNLIGAFGVVSVIVAIYYSGELVWRDRELRVHELVDATPAPDWTFLIPKMLGLSLVLVSLLIVAAAAGIVVQAYRGIVDYELDKYLFWYVLPQSLIFIQLAALAIFVQAMSPNKFIGWAVMVVFLIARIALANLGWDHILIQIVDPPSVTYSDMNGSGGTRLRAIIVSGYWTAFVVALLVIAYALWQRGTETRLTPRLRRLPHRLKGLAGYTGGAALAAFVALGGFIYVNTNVWNVYESAEAIDARTADYEKTLLRFETTPQPSITSVKLDLVLDPDASRLRTVGAYSIENRTGRPLGEVHLRWTERQLDVPVLAVDGATLVRSWDRFNYRIYRFATPMAPGERRSVRFETLLQQRGFRNSGDLTSLAKNGAFVNNSEFAPVIGMHRSALLSDPTTRRRHGLPAELRPAKLEDVSAQTRNYIGADWVTADITVTTSADQTPVAPGYKVSDVRSGARRTARFVTDAPILNFFSVQSAAYRIARERHEGVDLAVYYHPGHETNVPRMIGAMKAALDYFQPAFGPYQFRQARIVEFPYGRFAQAFANTIPYSENLGFIADFSNPEKIDYVTYVTAHEMAHQWWAHQVVGADMQGAAVLSETLAQYSALMVMEKTYKPENMRRFLRYELDSYLRARGGERLEELPLYRVENQAYIFYKKGGLVLYLLRDQLGEDAVNAALRSLISAHAFEGAPYPRSLDLVAALRANAPAAKQSLITDLMERITLYDVKVAGASVHRRADGKWDVAVTVDARKLYADGEGRQTESPLSETFDVGLFDAEPGKRNFDEDSTIALERRQVRTGSQIFRFVTETRPAYVGVDPFNKWIDRDTDDNVKSVR
ncbi:ABC transporter permease/M1 family aminopeptidase [Brevundimonas sp.]|uniref:ABC transporter permease/M1 family aminopeptidase n=1 Tax=Brevundimonas sp. TaxID=1871086 RepID=UPI003562E42F